jgi:hypothetical protein
MRQPRIKGQGESFYHCVSRVVDGRFLFQTQSPGSVEAEHFVQLMRRLEKAFCVQVLTYAFHRVSVGFHRASAGSFRDGDYLVPVLALVFLL